MSGPDGGADTSAALPAEAVVAALRDRSQTLATAESLTGGLVGATLTAVPGASAVYRGGLIVYATELKAELARVSPQTLAADGPVAARTAAQLARGAADVCGADWGLATTGVAGPDPQDGHPVGQVYVAVAGPPPDEVWTRCRRARRRVTRSVSRCRSCRWRGTGRPSATRPPGPCSSCCSTGSRPVILPAARRRPASRPEGHGAQRSVSPDAVGAAGYSFCMRLTPPLKQVLVRELIGESLREERMAQAKTLRAVSQSARVSLGYLSEVERGQKEASSELLAAICSALDVPLSVILNLVSEKMATHEQAAPAGCGAADHPRHGRSGRRLTHRPPVGGSSV